MLTIDDAGDVHIILRDLSDPAEDLGAGGAVGTIRRASGPDSKGDAVCLASP